MKHTRGGLIFVADASRLEETPRASEVWIASLGAGLLLGLLDGWGGSTSARTLSDLPTCASAGALVGLLMGVSAWALARLIRRGSEFRRTSEALCKVSPLLVPLLWALQTFVWTQDGVAWGLAALCVVTGASLATFFRKGPPELGWWFLLFALCTGGWFEHLDLGGKLGTLRPRLPALAAAAIYFGFLLIAFGSWHAFGPRRRFRLAAWGERAAALIGPSVLLLGRNALPPGYPSLEWIFAWFSWLCLLPIGTSLLRAMRKNARLVRVTWFASGLATCLALGKTGWEVVELHQTGLSPLRSPQAATLTTSFYSSLISPHDRLDKLRVALERGTGTSPFSVALPPFRPALPVRPKTIVLVTIDALRADRLKHVAPSDLVASSLSFERAYALASSTLLSLPALLASQYPSELSWRVGVTDGKQRIFTDPQKVPARVWTWPVVADLPEGHLGRALHAQGFATHAILSGGHTHFFDSGAGFERGFDGSVLLGGTSTSGEPSPEGTDERAVAAFRNLVANKDDVPLFVWIHLFGPHFPYPDRPDCDSPIPYDCDVEDSARHLREMIEILRDADRYDETLLVLSSDHGHSLGENGLGNKRSGVHARGLFEAQVRVPLLVKFPGGPAGRSSAPVSTLDIAPTLLSAVGAPPHGFHRGIDLRAIAAGAPRPTPIFLEQWQLRSDGTGFSERWVGAIFDGEKAVIDELRGRIFQFDLVKDPAEANNRFDLSHFQPTERGARLLSWISSFRKATSNNPGGLERLVRTNSP